MSAEDFENAKKLLAEASAVDLRIAISQEPPESEARIAAEYLLDEMERKGRDDAIKEEERRHKEALDVSRSANNLAKWAIVISIAALIVGALQKFW